MHIYLYVCIQELKKEVEIKQRGGPFPSKAIGVLCETCVCVLVSTAAYGVYLQGVNHRANRHSFIWPRSL